MTCVDIGELEQFASGTLDESDTTVVGSHLGACDSCRQRLDEIRRNLDMAGSIGQLAGDGRSMGMPSRLGPYCIIEQVGRGGMGVVYRAEQDHPRREVALKLIHPGATTPAALRRFEHEANLLARLHHPGIAQVFDAGTIDGQPYLAMEFVSGSRLDQFVQRVDPDIAERMRLLASICDAVHHAHMRGVIHRDLKPGNVLVVEDEVSTSQSAQATGHTSQTASAGAQVKVLDFGVARAADPESQSVSIQTGTGQLLGTVPFMSPEQVAGDAGAVDIRTDIYSLGVIGYQLLTGSLPYALADRSLPEAARIIRDEDPKRPRLVNARLGGDIETILLKALEKDPDRRYQSAAEFAADVRRCLNDEPILARPASTWYQLRKYARRNRAIATGVSVAAVTILAGAIVSMALAVRATRAERAAALRATEARTEADKFLAVNTFLNDMLASVDPVNSPGEAGITVHQVVERTAEQLDSGELATRPEVEVSVRTTIGNVYRALAEYEPAEKQLRAAVELGRRSFDGDHPDLAFAMHKLSRVLEDTGRFDEADRWCSDALAMRRRVLDAPHKDIANSMNNLGWLRYTMGRHDDGIQLMTDALEMRRALYGAEHEEIANSLNNLAAAAYQLGQFDRAEPLYRESLAMDTKLRGKLHPHVATTSANLAILLMSMGRLDEAEPLLRESLRVHQHVHGDQHPILAVLHNNLARMLVKQGRLDQAESEYRRSLEINRVTHGDDHPQVAVTLANLASLLVDLDRTDEAEPMLRQAMAINLESFGEAHPATVRARYHLAGLHQARGEFALAIEELEKGLAFAPDALGHDSRDYGLFLRRYGLCLLDSEAAEEAEQQLQEAYEVLNHPQHEAFAQQVARDLAQLCAMMDRNDDAAQWLARANGDQ